MPNLLLNYHHNEVKVTLELHLKFHKLTLAAEMFGVGDFWLEIRVIIKILSHPWYPRTIGRFSNKWSKKFWKKKIQNGQLKKTVLFKIANSQIFFAKIIEIGPWISSIDWWEGHWCVSSYMVMRLSDISSKTVKKCIFGVFRLFLRIFCSASQPYSLW